MYELIEDAHCEGKRHEGETRPLISLMLISQCHRSVPVCSLHVLLTRGDIPVLEPLTIRQAMTMTAQNSDPCYLVYECIDKPQLGGEDYGLWSTLRGDAVSPPPCLSFHTHCFSLGVVGDSANEKPVG